MRRITFLFLFISVACLSNCKKDSDALKPEEETNQPNTPIQFLRSFQVPGSDKITFDSATKNYQISLPESYLSNTAELQLSLNKNVVLIDSVGKATADSTIVYDFKGNEPLSFTLRDKEDKFAGSFTVYFEVEGTPKVELLTKQLTVNTNGFKSPLRFVSGIGTIPARPGQSGPVIKATNRKTGYSAEAPYHHNQENITFDSVEKLVGPDPIALEVIFPDEAPIVFEGLMFTRGEPTSRISSESKFIYSTKDSVFVSGGYFLPTAKYTVRFTSDFVKTPATAPLKYISPTNLNAEKLPANLAEGSYLLTFHEGDKQIGKGAIHISNTATKSIESIWKGELTQALNRNAEPVVFKKGDTFYAKPSPVEYGSSNTNFDVSKIPILRLKSGSTTVDLKPALAVVNWATAGVSYPVGKYVVPKTLAAGQYEVTAVFPDKKESKPYWSKMRVN